MNRQPQNGDVALKSVNDERGQILMARARIGARSILTMAPLCDFPRRLGVWCGDWLLIGYRLDGEPMTWLDSKNGARPKPWHSEGNSN